MRNFSDLIKISELKNKCSKCPVFSLYNFGPVVEENREDIPLEKGVYFAFEFDKEKAQNGSLQFKRLIYVGKATEDNTLRKRIGDHYTQHDLKDRESKESFDMDAIAFFYCVMDDDDEISDVEAAEIFKNNPPANTIGVNNYVGKTSPLMIQMTNEFRFVEKDLYQNPIFIKARE